MNLEKILSRIEKHALKTSLYSCISDNLSKLTLEEKKEAAKYYAKVAKEEIQKDDVFAYEKQIGKYFRKNDKLDPSSENLMILKENEKFSLITCALYSVLPFSVNPTLKDKEYEIIVEILKCNDIKPSGLSLERLYETQKSKLSETLIADTKNLYIALIKHHECVRSAATSTLKLMYTISSMLEEKPGIRKFGILDSFENSLKAKKIGYEAIYK